MISVSFFADRLACCSSWCFCLSLSGKGGVCTFGGSSTKLRSVYTLSVLFQKRDCVFRLFTVQAALPTIADLCREKTVIVQKKVRNKNRRKPKKKQQSGSAQQQKVLSEEEKASKWGEIQTVLINVAEVGIHHSNKCLKRLFRHDRLHNRWHFYGKSPEAKRYRKFCKQSVSTHYS